jgi:hypothetical protein
MDWAEPVGSIWTDSKAGWVKIDQELVNLPKGAVSAAAPLFDAWTTRQSDLEKWGDHLRGKVTAGSSL